MYTASSGSSSQSHFPKSEDKYKPFPVSAESSQSLPQFSTLNPQKEKLLLASPYTALPHLLDLSTLNQSQQLLAHALTTLQALAPNYATAPYISAFNWPAVIHTLRSLANSQAYTWEHQHFYIVVFRSRIPSTTNRIHLGELDQRAHAEATKSGGLLKYWFGVPDAEGRNMATCKLLMEIFYSPTLHRRAKWGS